MQSPVANNFTQGDNMKPINFLAIFFLLVFLAPSSGNAADALLRIFCEDADTGAEVYVNGKFSGECPVNQSVPEGSSIIRVVKNVDSTHERVFEQTVRLAGGNVKRLDVQLSAPRLTAAGQKAEDARLAVEREARAVRESAAAAEFNKLLAAAKGGDVNAMIAVADCYKDGNGVGKSDKEHSSWMAMVTGRSESLPTFMSSRLYLDRKTNGGDMVVREIIDVLARPTVNLRKVNIRDNDDVADFFAADPFFAMPPAAKEEEAVHNLTSKVDIGGGSYYTVTTKVSCKRDGRYADYVIEMPQNPGAVTSYTTSSRSVLGGLVSDKIKFAFPPAHKAADKTSYTTSVTSVHGQPFPLQPGTKFGLIYGVSSTIKTKYETTTELNCGVMTNNELLCVTMIKASAGVAPFAARYAYEPTNGCMFAK